VTCPPRLARLGAASLEAADLGRRLRTPGRSPPATLTPDSRCQALHHRGGSGLLVTAELKRAIVSESAEAPKHWFGVGVKSRLELAAVVALVAEPGHAAPAGY
jgi:hypothetical protein